MISEEASPSFYELISNKEIISNLVGAGKQPLVDVLSKHFRIIFIDGDNVEPQRIHLVNFLYR